MLLRHQSSRDGYAYSGWEKPSFWNSLVQSRFVRPVTFFVWRKLRFLEMRYSRRSVHYGVLSLIIGFGFLSLIYATILVTRLYGSVLQGNQEITYDYFADYLDTEGNIATSSASSTQGSVQKFGLQILNKNVAVRDYTVVYGDTLSEIAARFNVPMDLIIVASNGKVSRNTVLQAGQALLIPDRPGLIYQIRKGDTLASVLTKYSVNYQKFLQDNSHVNPDLLSVRQTVFLPDAKIPKTYARNWLRPGYGRVTSRFGWRRHPVFGYRHYHTGVDIAIRYGPVKAALSGTVHFTGAKGAYGNLIIIRHDRVYKTLYAHLNQIYVKSGQRVKRGQVIGISGNSGRSTGPHLHFEILRRGKPINPHKQMRI